MKLFDIGIDGIVFGEGLRKGNGGKVLSERKSSYDIFLELDDEELIFPVGIHELENQE